ncbi:Protein csh3 [Taphrina deformans PYCC 5710]|uniref:Protein csh3 n=1 Tax=Taphrina deformans (strain PYCC 5710 / ATCC 11124 / CBS 356.35 / IMI 108563 / JCM 9778 / NBRC 8474) TaxID=1097556 RepID=R4XAS5_TAPDE|nr:Protein csh3 [Taphrina deformans PYCC 5710]|eukprot:CCG81423.1 Protein csh3 [Taphrina deformans PYCC 5710]
MVGTDIPFINRTLGQVYTDLGYLVDVGVISDADYEVITAKIPRRHHDPSATPNLAKLNIRQDSPSIVTPGNGRQVPTAPQPARDNNPAPPAYTGVGQAEALYDYPGPDAGDLSFKLGDKIVIMEYVNNDWWRGESNGREGLFPSNYVRKTSDTGRPLEKVSYEEASKYPALPAHQYNPQRYQPVQYAPAPTNSQVNYAQTGTQAQPQQPVTVVQDKKNGKMHSIGSKVGNAALFGAGATRGKVVDAIF